MFNVRYTYFFYIIISQLDRCGTHFYLWDSYLLDTVEEQPQKIVCTKHFPVIAQSSVSIPFFSTQRVLHPYVFCLEFRSSSIEFYQVIFSFTYYYYYHHYHSIFWELSLVHLFWWKTFFVRKTHLYILSKGLLYYLYTFD